MVSLQVKKKKKNLNVCVGLGGVWLKNVIKAVCKTVLFFFPIAQYFI